jgi:hypothetical protein
VSAFNAGRYRLLSLVNYEMPVLSMPAALLPRGGRGEHPFRGHGVIVPLIGAGVKSKSAVVSAQRRLNCYLEPQRDQDKTPVAVYGTAGLTKVMDEGALPFRGGITVGDTLYVARGNIFESVNNAFVSTDLNAASRLTTNNGRCRWRRTSSSSCWWTARTATSTTSPRTRSRRSPRRCSRARRRSRIRTATSSPRSSRRARTRSAARSAPTG